MLLTRRSLLTSAAFAATGSRAPLHMLPTAGSDRLRVKASFAESHARAPVLRAGSRKAAGVAVDAARRHFTFDLPGLTPATRYDLELLDGVTGRAFYGPWPLRTLPHPEERLARFRLLVYTCAGGHDGVRLPDDNGRPYWVSLANRRKLIGAGLKMQPDAVLAIGDQVYWDLRFGRASGRAPMGSSDWARQTVGEFRRDIAALDTPNEDVLKRAAGPQIAELYGTMLQSVPTFFIQDDHDYYENDEAIPPGADPHGVSLPPDDFMLQLARGTQALYFPEFLPDPTRPAALNGSGEAYGTIRFGRAAELLVYDCRRYLSLTGNYAGFISTGAEGWLTARMKASNAAHVVNVPSTPIGWSAGKWGEWYPDLLNADGTLSTARPKYMWQAGWKLQHDRLLRAASEMTRGVPLFLSGDLHALAHAAIEQNGADDLRRNPVHTMLAGPVSTGPRGWPSAARGTPPRIATGMGLRETLAPLEMNGVSIVDFLPDKVDVQMLRWKIGRPESELDALEPFLRYTMPRAV